MKPGLYVATVRGVEGVAVYGPSKTGHFARVGDDGLWDRTTDVTDARPLVVLDPESDEDTERFRSAILDYGNGVAARRILRALAAPTPAEPMGLGAVMRDADGVLWIRDGMTALPWKATSPVPRQKWSALDSPEVLSDGWTP